MKKILRLLITILLLASSNLYAIGLWDIFNVMTKIQGIDLDMKNISQDTFNINKDQLSQLNLITNGLTGTHSYGSMNYDKNQFDWGKGSDNWQDMLSLYKTGGGSLAQVSGNLEKEFPIADNLGSSSQTENEYYRLQAQTTLASRSSSQLAFEQVSKESKVIEDLHNEIDKSKDNKSSVDLNNRLVSEQNNMSIQQTKLLALLVQQEAVNSQEKANHAKENAEFFDFKK